MNAAFSWRAFALRRALRLAILLPLVALCAFLLVSASPIDPVGALVGAEVMHVGVEQQAAIAHKWGLDQPPAERFLRWFGNALQGDLGRSMIFDDEVIDVIGERLLASLALMALAWTLSGLIGFGLGILAGALEGSLWDRLIRGYAFVLASAPTFWIAILLLLFFAVQLGWAPFCCAAPPGVLPDEATLLQRLHHIALPALTLSLLGVAQVTLYTRDKVREVMASDYALLSFAQGESRLGVARRHALRNAALPALTLQFASLSELFGGSILAETVFTYPGLGAATVDAGTRGDAPLLLGIALFAALFVFAGNTLGDVLARWLDPRHSRAARNDMAADA
ncbi:ABC transporter permease [Uliginosibacterium sp. H1]|uniref:ABC transporter permease n=1 Tax=Uliginosibacterium sp. H1 TaxID=3114757 RepID=UPI002E16C110|nr:ABC transporter permease [Uliginosibacterium sp. H1]